MTFTQDISTNESINQIYNKMLKVVNFFSDDNSENSKILETFTLEPLTDDDIRVFNNIVIKEKEKKKFHNDINFTAQELYDVMQNLDLKANVLTQEQKSNRKKILTFIKNELIQLKESGKLYTYINYPAQLSSFLKQLFSEQAPETSIAPIKYIKNGCSLYAECNFTNGQYGRFNITEIEKYNDINIKSIKSQGVLITGFSEPNFKGLQTDYIYTDVNVECLSKPIKSIIIKPIIDTVLPSITSSKSSLENYCYLYSNCNFNSNSKTNTVEKTSDDLIIMNSNTEKKYDNINIKSIKSNEFILTLYSEPNFRGEKIVLDPRLKDDISISNYSISFNQMNLYCLDKTVRSIILTPIIPTEILLEIPPETPPTLQMKENALAAFTLFQNTIDLFLNEINDIDNPKICPTCLPCPICPPEKDNTYLYLFILLLLIIIFGLAYNLSTKK